MKKVHLKGQCQICGKEIELKVFWKKYCSQKCRMDGYVLDRAEELKKKLNLRKKSVK